MAGVDDIGWITPCLGWGGFGHWLLLGGCRGWVDVVRGRWVFLDGSGLDRLGDPERRVGHFVVTP